VVQIGGSLGGLFPAVVMKRLGHGVRILERNSTPLYNRGAGVSASEDTQLYLKMYDRTQHPVVVPTWSRKYLDLTGEIIRCENHQHDMTSWGLLYDLLRANFDSRESDSCIIPKPVAGEGEVVYSPGHTLMDIRENGCTVDLDFKDDNGEIGTMSADLVLAADGANSTVRTLLCPEVKRLFVGYAAWRGTAPESTLSANDALAESLTFYHSEGLQMLA
jgi:2-polyprenyl-6-methoxyphenol hydroxylase-like FAD-dependent oxidoreductase